MRVSSVPMGEAKRVLELLLLALERVGWLAIYQAMLWASARVPQVVEVAEMVGKFHTRIQTPGQPAGDVATPGASHASWVPA